MRFGMWCLGRAAVLWKYGCSRWLNISYDLSFFWNRGFQVVWSQFMQMRCLWVGRQTSCKAQQKNVPCSFSAHIIALCMLYGKSQLCLSSGRIACCLHVLNPARSIAAERVLMQRGWTKAVQICGLKIACHFSFATAGCAVESSTCEPATVHLRHFWA